MTVCIFCDTHSKDQLILEVGKGLVAFLTVVLSTIGKLCHLLITVRVRASFVETVLRLDKRNGHFATDVVWFVSMTKI